MLLRCLGGYQGVAMQVQACYGSFLCDELRFSEELLVCCYSLWLLGCFEWLLGGSYVVVSSLYL